MRQNQDSLSTDMTSDVADHVDRLREIYVQSDNVPLTLGEFIDELANGEGRSSLPSDALLDAGCATRYLAGLAAGMNVTLTELLSQAGRGQALANTPEECDEQLATYGAECAVRSETSEPVTPSENSGDRTLEQDVPKPRDRTNRDALLSAAGAREPYEVLTADEVAALLRLNRKTVYEALARGEIPSRRIGTAYRISRAAVLEWLRGQDRVAGARRKR